MGMFLIIWDKLFGTFQPELPAGEYQPLAYGLTKNIENPNASHWCFMNGNRYGMISPKKAFLSEPACITCSAPTRLEPRWQPITSKQMREKESIDHGQWTMDK